jgi:hypothetical protein
MLVPTADKSQMLLPVHSSNHLLPEFPCSTKPVIAGALLLAVWYIIGSLSGDTGFSCRRNGEHTLQDGQYQVKLAVIVLILVGPWCLAVSCMRGVCYILTVLAQCIASTVFIRSTPTECEHEQLVKEFRQSAIVARFKNQEGNINALLDMKVLMDVFTTLRRHLTSRFSYVNCLAQEDQKVFAEQLMQELRKRAHDQLAEQVLARVASGGISSDLWTHVMGHCSAQGLFQHDYVLYRRAYWGENSNDFSDTKIYAFYHCKVREFCFPGSCVGGTKREAIPILFDGYGQLTQLSNWFLNPSQGTDPSRNMTPIILY